MPSLHLHLLSVRSASSSYLATDTQRLHARHFERERDQAFDRGAVGLSPAAIGFLVPLFIVFLFAPFLCVCMVRRRRQPPTAARPRLEPASVLETRETAREKLDAVTQVSTPTYGGRDEKFACVGVSVGEEEREQEKEGIGEKEKESEVECLSILERDCAICLSPLHPSHSHSLPRPPPPSFFPSITPSIPPPTIPPPLEPEKEETLRLRSCGHEFHAECLVSWVVVAKVSCPVCRGVFLGKDGEGVEGEARDEVGEEGNRGTERRDREGV